MASHLDCLDFKALDIQLFERLAFQSLGWLGGKLSRFQDVQDIRCSETTRVRLDYQGRGGIRVEGSRRLDDERVFLGGLSGNAR
jgi:hypothetical protein